MSELENPKQFGKTISNCMNRSDILDALSIVSVTIQVKLSNLLQLHRTGGCTPIYKGLVFRSSAYSKCRRSETVYLSSHCLLLQKASLIYDAAAFSKNIQTCGLPPDHWKMLMTRQTYWQAPSIGYVIRSHNVGLIPLSVQP